MSFNADKCFTLHISKQRKPTENNYLLYNQVLEVAKVRVPALFLGVRLNQRHKLMSVYLLEVPAVCGL
jgi:hypothetical protein